MKNIMVRLMLLTLVLGLALAGFSTANGTFAAAKAARKPVKLRLANLAYGLGSIPHELGVAKGIFAKHGIDLQVIYFAKGGPEAAAGVASGQVDMGSFGTPILTAISKGIPIKIVAAPPVKQINFVLVAQNGIKRVQDLKGKTIATGALGGGNHQSLLKVLYANGLTENDVKIVATGGADEELILKSGKVEAVNTSGVTVIKLVKEKVGHVLAKSVDYYGRYQHSYVFATDALIKNRPQTVRNFLKASRESYRYAQSHPEELVAFARKKTELDADLIRAFYASDSKNWDLSFAVDREGTANAVKVLQELGEMDSSVKFEPQKWLDLRFVK